MDSTSSETAYDETFYQKLSTKICDIKEGVEVKDRKWHAKNYERCFVGSEATDWIMKETGVKDRKEAVKIGEHLRKLGLFAHVTYGHEFEDKFLFYRFAVSDDPVLASSTEPLPPGSFGVPVLGETLQLQNDILGFLGKKAEKYQGFFKTNVVFNKVAVFGDPDSMKEFNNDKYVHRENSMPPHWVDIFCNGDSKNATVNMIDGEKHKRRKGQLMKCFSKEAMSSYIPTVEKVVQSHLSEWKKEGNFKLVDKLRSLCFEECSRMLLGIEPSSELTKLFDAIMQGFASLPVNLPGTALAKALNGRDKILQAISESLASHKTALPQEKDAFVYLLEEQKQPNSELPDEVICYEMLHFMIAGMAPMFTLHTYLVYELMKDPQLKQKLSKEINQVTTDGPLTLDILDKLSFADDVIKEVQRFYAGYAVPISWGKIVEPMSVNRCHVPEGWNAIGCFYAVSHSTKVWSDPEKFDPSRFERGEHKKHPCAFVPQGLTTNVEVTHGCAGYQLTVVLLKIFLVHLLRGDKYKFQLVPKQKFNVNPALVPVMPIDGFKIDFSS